MNINTYETSDGGSNPLDLCPKFEAQNIVSYKYDLHLVYLALMKNLLDQNIPWNELPWASRLRSFECFLSFSWPVTIVSNGETGKPHIVMTHHSYKSFKTKILRELVRHPKTIFVFPDIRHSAQVVDSFQRYPCNGVVISDYASYSSLLATFQTIDFPDSRLTNAFSAFRRRVRKGDPNEIKKVWDMKDRTFLAMEFKWHFEDNLVCTEWGYAALCCSELHNIGHWPPIPNKDYRRGHYIVAEYFEKSSHKFNPSCPWDYAFGKSKVVLKADLLGIIRDTISTFASPDSDYVPNTLVIVAHNFGLEVDRLKMLNIELPNNLLAVDTGLYELTLFNAGCRGTMIKFKTMKELELDSESIYVEPIRERIPSDTISLKNILLSFETHPILPVPHQADSQLDENGSNSGGVQDEEVTPNITVASKGISTLLPDINLWNTGNRSFMCLYAFQAMTYPRDTEIPHIVAKSEKGKEASWSSKL